MSVQQDVTFEELPQDTQLDMIHQSLVRIENQNEQILGIMSQIGAAAANLQDNIPPGIKAMLGM